MKQTVVSVTGRHIDTACYDLRMGQTKLGEIVAVHLITPGVIDLPPQPALIKAD